MILKADSYEELARIMCEHHSIDPDKKVTALKEETVDKLGNEFLLWEYWAEEYIKPLFKGN